ncbi:MFS transporter [Hypoxylon crocopeplum]|nr:MFS transporter [Hypoxylon crocopeplum]
MAKDGENAQHIELGTTPDLKADIVEFDENYKRRLTRKIDMRLVPLCAFIYLVNYLDRSNIGNGKILNQETGDSFLQKTDMTSTDYSIVLTVFGIAYTLFDVPANWIMKRYIRPSHWLSLLMFLWGALTIGFAWVQNFPTVVVLRFLIGVFEAGFFPGIVYLITFWYTQEQRSLRIAFVLASATLAGAFGGCIGYGVGFLNGEGGLEGFRWLFVIEGLMTIVCLPLVILFLPNWPTVAKWLDDDEKRCLISRLDAESGGFTRERASRREVLETCFQPRMIAHYLAYLSNTVVLNSLAYFTPTIVARLGYTSITAQLMTVPPWVVGYAVSLGLAYSADRFNSRGWHVAVATFLSGVGFLACTLLPADAYAQRYGCLYLIACGAFPSASPMVGWVTCNVPSARTMGLAAAINNGTVGIASIISVWIWPESEAATGFRTGNIVCSVASFLTTAIVVGLRLHYGKMNKNGKPDASGMQRMWAY